jgi:hypothetical protein
MSRIHKTPEKKLAFCKEVATFSKKEKLSLEYSIDVLLGKMPIRAARRKSCQKKTHTDLMDTWKIFPGHFGG